MTKNGCAIRHKIISITAVVAAMLYLSFSVVSAVAVFTEIDSCCYASIENNESPYTGLCCVQAGVPSECCNNEIPAQNETFLSHEMLDGSVYRNNVCNLPTNISDSLNFTELSGIVCEERFITQNITYFIFKPPKRSV